MGKEKTHPYVNSAFGFQVAMTEAKSPTPSAMQSKNIWMAEKRTQSDD